MNEKEQSAFVDAFGRNVSGIDDHIVADFVARYESGEDIPYASDQTPIMDALGMWHAGKNYIVEGSKTSRFFDQRAFVNYLVDNMSIDDLKSYARENLHQLFKGQSDFEFNETMLNEGFDPRGGDKNAN